MHKRIKSSGMSRSSRVLASMDGCDILQGMEIEELTQPNDTAMPKMSQVSKIFSKSSTEPFSKLSTAPSP